MKRDEILKATHILKHEIILKDKNVKPIKQRYYPVSEKLEKIMHDQIAELKRKGIIQESASEWNNPIVMIKRQNGKPRLCVDLRALNNITKEDAYPLPYIDIILNKLKQARYISTIYLNNAYHQIELEENSKELTAFTLPGKGLWQFEQLPFGLSGTGACFQRLIDKVVGDLEPNVYAYLDDIVLVTNTFEEHINLLRRLLLKIRDAELTINREKTKFCVNELNI